MVRSHFPEGNNVTTQMFVRGAIVVSVIVAVGSTAGAQTPAGVERRADPARPQVQTFEMVLGRAIETAGRNFATRAREFAPEMMALPTGETPNVTGVAVHDMGLYVFHVQVPGIDLTLLVMNLMANRPQFAGTPAGPQQPVSGRVASTDVVAADPMVPSGEGRRSQLDFQVEYRNQVREALVDAIVDNSGSLPLGTDESVLVVAGGTDSSGPNPLYRRTSQRLVLRAKASDLAAFREGRITRDEAKRRVLASDF
jgi:hypothetical protein